MLAHLQQRIMEALTRTNCATLATDGPAGLQATGLPCRNRDAVLYVLVPGTSEHLANLGERPDVVVATPAWQLRGTGRVLPNAERAAAGVFADDPAAFWCEVVEVQPRRVDILRPGGWDVVETIDIP